MAMLRVDHATQIALVGESRRTRMAPGVRDCSGEVIMAGRAIQRMVSDQATRLRELVHHRRASRAQTLAITSGKGGVGKSSVAVNLSICLAATGRRVTLVDVDLGLANADLLMNLRPRYTLSHVLSGVRSVDQVVMTGPGGIQFVPGASGIPSVANLSELERQSLLSQLQTLETSTDMIVLDCGAGIARNVLGFGLLADRVLVVTTPQPTALTDAYATIKVLLREGYRGEIHLLVNMVQSKAEAKMTFQRLEGVTKRFLNFPVADGGYILHDTAVELAVRERVPFVIRYPESCASVCMTGLAKRMTSSTEQREGGFFKRVVGLFV